MFVQSVLVFLCLPLKCRPEHSSFSNVSPPCPSTLWMKVVNQLSIGSLEALCK